MESTMPENETRRFALRTSDGNEPSVFTGRAPRQAAMKAARRLEPAPSQDTAEAEEICIRETGEKKIHVYKGWAWEENAPDNKPNWMPEEITKANVSKQGIEQLEEL